jgi:drug/metabolite transporter (DMT)-like permease
VIALGPGALSFGGAALVAFLGSIVYSAFLVMTRVLRGTPEPVLAAWQVIGGIIVGVIAAPFLWQPVAHWTDGALMGFLGVVAVLAILSINRSLVLAPASVVVPYQYTMIIWAVIFGYFFFANVPTMQILLGAAIIIGAGLFIFFREQQVGKPAAEEIAPER